MGIEAITTGALLKALKKAYEKDRGNRYRLNAPWSLPRLVEPVPDYHGEHVTVEDSVITIQPYEDCDGCTLSPDRVGRWILVEAALAHDAIYGEMDAIAAAWGWPVSRVRRWADDVFYGIASARAPHVLARLYWRGIRACGGIAHAVGKIVAIILLAALATGCAGCRSPVDPFGGEPISPADYEQTAGGK